jgi:hypothetical protein
MDTDGGTFVVVVVTVTLLNAEVANVPFACDVMANPT